MNNVGIVGANGQLGSHLFQHFGNCAHKIGRDGKLPREIGSIIWAAGSANNRMTHDQANLEYEAQIQTLSKVDFFGVNHVILL